MCHVGSHGPPVLCSALGCPPKPFCCTPRHAKHNLGTHCYEKAPLWQATTCPSYYFRPFELESHRKKTIAPSGRGGMVWDPKQKTALRGQATSPWAGHKPPRAHGDRDAFRGAGRRLKWQLSDRLVLAVHTCMATRAQSRLSNTRNTGLSTRSSKSTKSSESIQVLRPAALVGRACLAELLPQFVLLPPGSHCSWGAMWR